MSKLFTAPLIDKSPNQYRAIFTDSKEHSTFESWERAVKNEASRLLRNGESQDDVNEFVGDMLEVLAELFFETRPTNPRFGLTNYVPVCASQEEDYGVDGVGINANGHKTAVQVKFRSNPNTEDGIITYGDVARTMASAIGKHFQLKDVAEHDYTIFLFTNVNDSSISWRIDKAIPNKVVIISRKTIKKELGGSSIDEMQNITFWEYAHRRVTEVTG